MYLFCIVAKIGSKVNINIKNKKYEISKMTKKKSDTIKKLLAFFIFVNFYYIVNSYLLFKTLIMFKKTAHRIVQQ